MQEKQSTNIWDRVYDNIKNQLNNQENFRELARYFEKLLNCPLPVNGFLPQEWGQITIDSRNGMKK